MHLNRVSVARTSSSERYTDDWNKRSPGTRPEDRALLDPGGKTFYDNYELSMNDLRKATTASKQTAGCLFTNFEDVRLTDEERVYLNAASIGDMGVIRLSLEESENNQNFNVNCVDYMGRNALHLAVDIENVEAVEMLMDKLSFECIEEALLHAISKGNTKIVRIIIEHPSYMAGEDQLKRVDSGNAFFRTTEKSQFSPDITPLILAAHYNNHEMVQMFLSRNHRIDKPHPISCQCLDCQVRQDYDSLKRSRSRLNAYRALASPAYMALSSPDPIMTTFELRQEMMRLAEIEKEFKREYLMLVEQCRNFACEMMDLCRGTQEVEAVISEFVEERSKLRDPLGRLRLAISIWYGAETAFLQSWSLSSKIGLSIVGLPIVVIMCVCYIIMPNMRFARALRCPAAKFATHSLSHGIFLALLAVATFFKPFKTDKTLNWCEICIFMWIIAQTLSEAKQVYFVGLKPYFYNYYNVVLYIILALYIASFAARQCQDKYFVDNRPLFNGTTEHVNSTAEIDLTFRVNATFQGDVTQPVTNRSNWFPFHPMTVSEALFAVANVLSFARATYLMPAFEALGPLQISFTRMLVDIIRFMCLYVLVLFAFMVGLRNLYFFYAKENMTPLFTGFSSTLHTLFWSMFGQTPLSSMALNSTSHTPDHQPYYLVNIVGIVLLAVYHGVAIIVLVNMLIAMMSHSFENIQEDCDVEWKFARTKLWLNYIDNGSTLPVPLNLLPTPQSMRSALLFVRKLCIEESYTVMVNTRSTEFVKFRREKVCRERQIESHETSYADIMQRLVKRYLFKMERENSTETAEEMQAGAAAYGFGSNLVVPIDSDSDRRRSGSTPPPCADSSRLNSNSQKRSKRLGSMSANAPPIMGGSMNLQLPQLDGIQRTQKVLDMRLQSLQAQSEQLNAASGNARIKEEIEHLRVLTNENQKALFSIVKAIAQMQDQVLMLNNNMEQWVIAQASGHQVRTVRIEERKPRRHRDSHARRQDDHSTSTAANAPSHGGSSSAAIAAAVTPTNSAPASATIASAIALNERRPAQRKDRDRELLKRI